MPLIRYNVTLGPDAARYPTAFAPVPASTTAKYANAAAQGQTLTGQPGTRGIPAPYPVGTYGGVAAGPGAILPGGSGGGMAGGSRYAPPVWYPSQYYATQDLWGGIGGVRVYSDNAPPIPTSQAVGTTQVPGMKPRQPRWLRNRQVAARPNAPRWPRVGTRG
jgi:hypothetical protein